MFVRTANREDPDQTASWEAVRSGSALCVLPGNSVQNFRTFYVAHYKIIIATH